MNKIERLTAEILLLQERKRGSEELAELLEVSRRTIIRDIQALCEMGVPVIAQDGVAGGYWLPEDYTIQPLQLTWKEAMLLMLAMGSISKMADAPFEPERASLLAKIHALLPDKHRERVESILRKVEIEVPARPQRSPFLQQLVEATDRDEWLKIEYRTGDRGFEAIVKPQRVYADRGFWYIAAKRDGQTRNFRIDRIISIGPSEPPVDQSKEELPYHHPSHPLLRVLLTATGVHRVQLDPQLGPDLSGDAAQTLEFHCPPGELEWYSRYFGGMGSDAVIESPPELIEKIKARAQEILEIYSKR